MPVKKMSCEQIEAMISSHAFPEFNDLQECRNTVDDCLAGQRTIKEKIKYLPPNDWQKVHKEQYEAFLRRALFPGETKYALDIYEGLFSLGEPKITLPEDGRLDYIIQHASVYNDSLKRVQLRLNSEQMCHGLRCLLVEVKQNAEQPFFIREYSASKFLRSHFKDIDGESVADFILVDESEEVYSLTTFTNEVIYKLRILALDGNGEYYQRSIFPYELNDVDVLNPPNDDERVVYPALSGKRFNRIPFVWCGVTSLSGSTLEYPPMLSLANTELALYVAMANHSMHIYQNTQEILVFTGVPKEAIPKDAVFGCGSYIALKNSDAKAQYVSTNGVGFGAEKDEIEQLKTDIEQKRLSLMSAKSHQSGTVVGMEQNSRSAPLRSVVETSGAAITLILQYMALWMGENAETVDSIRYVPSQQFANTRVNLSEFIALCKAVFDGEVQMLESDLYNMARESGYIHSSMPWETFKRHYDLESDERRRAQSILPTTTGNPFAVTEDDEQTA